MPTAAVHAECTCPDFCCSAAQTPTRPVGGASVSLSNGQRAASNRLFFWRPPTAGTASSAPTPADVERLRGTVQIEHTLARLGAARLWQLLHDRALVRALGALTGNQAMQQVKAGLKAIYVSGWQVAADANIAGEMYPDQSLYPSYSVPALVRRINNALQRADQIEHGRGQNGTHWFAPIVADAEAGFGGPLNAFELMKAMIEAGAAGVHFEDQLASEKKCGHLGGKVLVPTRQFIRTLNAARLAADVCGVRRSSSRAPTRFGDADHQRRRRARRGVPHRRAHGGGLLPRPRRARAGDRARARLRALRRPGLVRDLDAGPRRGARVRRRRSTRPSRASCSPTTARRPSTGGKHLDDAEIATFQEKLAELGYRFQFVTLAGFHALNAVMFELAAATRRRAWRPMPRSRSASSRSRRTATPPCATSARSAPAISTRARGGLRRPELHARAEGLDRRGAVHRKECRCPPLS